MIKSELSSLEKTIQSSSRQLQQTLDAIPLIVSVHTEMVNDGYKVVLIFDESHHFKGGRMFTSGVRRITRSHHTASSSREPRCKKEPAIWFTDSSLATVYDERYAKTMSNCFSRKIRPDHQTRPRSQRSGHHFGWIYNVRNGLKSKTASWFMQGYRSRT